MTLCSTHTRKIAICSAISVGLLLVVLLPLIADAQTSPGNYLLSLLHSFVVGVFGFFAGISGLLLDFAINDMVIGFGEAYRDGGLGFVIDNMWVIVRDIFNLTFIFGLVFIGLRMIFDSANSNTRKMLIYLIMAALLVNFSLFITKFVVDFSNIAAVQLVNSFEGDSITSAIVDEIGLSSLYKTDEEAITKMFNGMSTAAGLGFIFSTMVILIVTTFVFAAGAFLLIIRFAVLNLYMLLSPLMFIGWVFPAAAGVTKQYWSGFLGRAFFAPAYILMLYFSFQIIKGYGDITTFATGSFTNLFADPSKASVEAILPPFILTAVFLIASIVVAQKLGANGADGVISLGRSLTGKARRIAMDKTVGVAGRYAVDKTVASDRYARVNARINNNRLLGSAVTVGSLGALSKRNRQALTDLGKAAKFGGEHSLSDNQKFEKEQKIRDNKALVKGTNSKAVADNLKVLEQNTSSLTDLTKAMKDLGDVFGSMSSEERSNMSAGELSKPHLAAQLTDNHMKELESSGNFTLGELADIKKARGTAQKNLAQYGFATTTNTAITSAMNNPPAAPAPGQPASAEYTEYQNYRQIALEKTLLKGGVEAAGNLPHDVFTQPNMYEYITQATLERRIRNGGFTNAQMDSVRTAIETYLRQPTTPQNVIKSWDKWTKDSPLGLRLGLTTPQIIQPQNAGPANNANQNNPPLPPPLDDGYAQ